MVGISHPHILTMHQLCANSILGAKSGTVNNGPPILLR